MAPIGEMAPGCAKNTKNIKKPVRTRCHLTHDYGSIAGTAVQGTYILMIRKRAIKQAEICRELRNSEVIMLKLAQNAPFLRNPSWTSFPVSYY